MTSEERIGGLGIGLISFVVLAKLFIWLLTGERYGYMSDELYFLDAGLRPAFGYVDFPPLIAWLAGLLQWLGLDSLFALRGFSHALGIGVTLLGAELCRLLGGTRFACWLTALVLLLVPGLMSVQGLFTMNVLDQLWWALAFWAALCYLQRGKAGFMLALGLVLGLGVLTKLSILALCASLPLACLLWNRTLLMRREAVWAAVLAMAVAAPFFLWEWRNDFPFVDFVSAYNSAAPVALVLQNPLLGMVLTMNPLFALLWGPGSFYLFFAGNSALRLLGTSAWLCLCLFVFAGVKFYFAVPVFLLFIVSGALFWDRILAPPASRILRAGLVAIVASGILVLPTAVPLLPAPLLNQAVEFMAAREQAVYGQGKAQIERYFPHFAEMGGWRELLQLSVQAWESLEPEQRQGAVLVAAHYGQAAALNMLDKADQLPPAHGRHMSYHLWSKGLRYDKGLYIGFGEAELTEFFGRVEYINKLNCQLCTAREQNLSIYYAAEPKLKSQEIHRRLRRYYAF